MSTARTNALQVNQALDSLPILSTTFDTDSLSQELEMTTKLIASREALGMNRQVFFIGFGG